MPRTATVTFDNIVIDATTDDLIELDAATDHPIEVIGWNIGQHTDLGDAQEEEMRMLWVRGNTSSGTGGSAVTPRPLDDGDTVSFTCEAGNVTTAASGGTAVEWEWPFNIRLGSDVWLPDGCGLWTRGSNLLVIRFKAAPADSISFSGQIWVKEY